MRLSFTAQELLFRGVSASTESVSSGLSVWFLLHHFHHADCLRSRQALTATVVSQASQDTTALFTPTYADETEEHVLGDVLCLMTIHQEPVTEPQDAGVLAAIELLAHGDADVRERRLFYVSHTSLVR